MEKINKTKMCEISQFFHEIYIQIVIYMYIYNTIDIKFALNLNLMYAILIQFLISTTNLRWQRFIVERGRDVSIEIAHAVIPRFDSKRSAINYANNIVCDNGR